MSNERKPQKDSSPPKEKPEVPLKDVVNGKKGEPEGLLRDNPLAPEGERPVEECVLDLCELSTGERIRRVPQSRPPPPRKDRDTIPPDQPLFADDGPDDITVEDRMDDVEEMLTGERARRRKLVPSRPPPPRKDRDTIPPDQPLFNDDEQDLFAHREPETAVGSLEALYDEARHRVLEDTFDERAMTLEGIENGLTSTKEHKVYELSRNELAACEEMLPEGQKRWIVPFPEETEEEHILAVLDYEPKIQFGERTYCVMEHGVLEASRRCARVGNTLHIWPEEMTNYGFLKKIGADTSEYEQVRWHISATHKLTREEALMCGELLPAERPRVLHPVPDQDTKNERNMKILSDYAHTNQIKLGGRKYYIFGLASVEEWRDAVTNLPAARLVFRKDDVLHVGDEKKNGGALFGLGNNEGQCGSLDMPPLPPTGLVIPAKDELLQVQTVFGNCERRYLCPLPQSPGDMDAEEFQRLIRTSMTYLEKEEHSPLLVLSGRWYMASEHAYPGSIKATFEDDKVRIHKFIGEDDS